MKNLIGVMQGRLLPKFEGRYQAHPVNYWQKEFQIAKDNNLDCIEFILDFNKYELNPLLNEKGIEEIKELSLKTGVAVKTVCADYFMESPLFIEDSLIYKSNQQVLLKLIKNSNEIGINNIVIPCVDKSSLDNKFKVNAFVKALKPALQLCEIYQINISLETDLNPDLFIELISKFDSNNITVNYDIGNSASLGYNPAEELEAYGDRISDIHIKDRELGGGPVILGTGNADFKLFFDLLKNYNYTGPFVMQAFRDDEGVEIFKQQLQWILPFIKQ
jgi:L-ribulose-5-phosphate 3-epimerase